MCSCVSHPMGGMEVGLAPLHSCGRQERGSSHAKGHGDLPFPEEWEFWGDPALQGRWGIFSSSDPQSGGCLDHKGSSFRWSSAGRDVAERREQYHTELSRFVHAQVLSWPACHGGVHVGIMGLYVTPLRWEKAREKNCLWHMPEQCGWECMANCPAQTGPSREKLCSCAAPGCWAVLYPEPAWFLHSGCWINPTWLKWCWLLHKCLLEGVVASWNRWE